MKEKEKNIYGIHQYTLTRRRKVRGKKRKQTKTKVVELLWWEWGDIVSFSLSLSLSASHISPDPTQS